MSQFLFPSLSPTLQRLDRSLFKISATHRIALPLLGQRPMDTHNGDTDMDTKGRLQSLQPEPDLDAASSNEVGPLEVWWALEDLWLRAAQGMAVTVDLCGPAMRLTVHRLRAGWDGPMTELRRPLLDLDTYRWHQAGQGGQAGCFVSLLAPEGDDLVATLTPTRVIVGWPEGGDLVYLVRALLLRLKALSSGRRRP